MAQQTSFCATLTERSIMIESALAVQRVISALLAQPPNAAALLASIEEAERVDGSRPQTVVRLVIQRLRHDPALIDRLINATPEELERLTNDVLASEGDAVA
jgi:protein-disulfide isomerase-like protein with CxxC motif